MSVDYLKLVQSKLHSLNSAQEYITNLRNTTQQIVVFTNGCFDLLHRGHYTYLARAASLGSCLVVGLNSDASVQRLKGNKRPIHTAADRALALASLQCVDVVVSFEEDTPLELIKALAPDVLVKGGDYSPDSIVGAAEVRHQGGTVLTLPFEQGYSTTHIIERLTT
jgi:D-beta-D-heptose 7-phosphate kinase/D-beta-D-heptose 1-phosphate adenosyltransferase